MSTSITINITHNLVPGGHVQNKILIIHVLPIYVSETYNTLTGMSLHALGISVDVHIELFDNSLLTKSC